MHRRITPSLVEEIPSPVQVVEVILIRLAPPEAHVGNLKVRPEVASRVSISLLVMVWPADLIRQPVHGVVLVNILGVLGNEFQGLGPQSRDRVGRIIEIDGEAVGLVVVLHVAEDVIVDITEEVNLGLHAPVVLRIGQSRVVIEEATVPAAHLVVGNHVGVLDLLFLENLGGFLVEVHVDPFGDSPVFLRDEFVAAFCFGKSLRLLLEFFGERDIVEEGPGVVELVVPCSFEVAHGGEHVVELLISYEGK